MSQEFIKELERLKAKQAEQGGFNTTAPVAPSFQPQAPQELSTPEFGPTLANEAQLPVLAPAVQTPAVQVETPFFQPTESGQRLASGISSAKDAVFSAANSVSEAGGNLANSTSGVVADLINQSTGGRVNLQSPSASGVATKDNAGAPITDASQLRAFMSGLNEEAAASEPAATLAPEVPAPAVAAPEVMATPESIADLSVNGTDVVTPEAITEAAPAAPQVQAPQGLTTAGGQPLAEFLAGDDAAPSQQLDAQGRMIDPDVDRSSFEKASADREARQAARPDFGEAVSDRERRAARGDGISDADRRDIAKAQSPNASASDRARGMKVAEKAGLDWRTGQPLKQDKETGGLTDYQAITAQQRQTEIDMKISEGMEEKEAKRVVAYEESRNNVRSTRDSFEKLKPVAEEIALLSGSKFTEGVLGWTASKLPFSTDAAQIERLTTEFEGSAFLQGLIDAKAKGATFGALSEREGDRILGQWGKITSPDSTNEQRIKAINSMLDSIQRSSERAESDHSEKFPELSSRSVETKSQGSTKGKRYADDQDYGAKVDTYYKG